MRDLDDTIAAIATAPGAAGLAVVRLSGARARGIADAVFAGGGLASVPANTLRHGWAVAADGVRLDEVVAAVFRAPHSYTREDVVELSCHGGRLSAERVLGALLAAGARLAGPGEFTLRAFLNGRLDLAQAEAVADVIEAETSGAHALALAQLAGELSARLGTITERLRDAAAEVEARVDFAEDVGGVEVPAPVIDGIAAAESDLAALLEGAAYARAIREGVRVALVGRPNVGKSSLFNALLGEHRAIVTAEPGTTRDLVSEPLEIAGIRVTLTDTAGLREGGDEAESEGVARARAALERSGLVIWVIDAAAALEAGDHAIAGSLTERRVIAALNKSDLPAVAERAEIESLVGVSPCAWVRVSARTGAGVRELEATLARLLAGDAGTARAVANPRHVEALDRARSALARARAAAAAGAPGEIVALELRESLGAIGEVTGETVREDLLDRIFRRFCVGK
jgi:tRNA modification GTPase